MIIQDSFLAASFPGNLARQFAPGLPAHPGVSLQVRV